MSSDFPCPHCAKLIHINLNVVNASSKAAMEVVYVNTHNNNNNNNNVAVVESKTATTASLTESYLRQHGPLIKKKFNEVTFGHLLTVTPDKKRVEAGNRALLVINPHLQNGDLCELVIKNGSRMKEFQTGEILFNGKKVAASYVCAKFLLANGIELPAK
jgi:hypothetical protein